MNSKTPASRRARAACANRWVKQQVDAGAYRLSVLLPHESAAALDRLAEVYGSKRAAVIAAIQTEERKMNAHEGG